MLIAEIGNQHFGDFEHFKELIRAAKDSGADLVKSQAFLGKDISGSMPKDFYTKLEFKKQQYIDLIAYAKDVVNIPLFYSIFSQELLDICYIQSYQKLSGSMVRKNDFNYFFFDQDNCFASIPNDIAVLPNLQNAKLMYVCEYLPRDPELHNISRLSKEYKRKVGYSDHTIGINSCLTAIDVHEVPWIEKHFTIKTDFKYNGVLYRDCIHAATPKEFSKLAYHFNKNKGVSDEMHSM